MRPLTFLLATEPPPRRAGVLVAVVAVALCTLLIYPLKQVAPVVSLGVVYLLAVLIVSAIWGALLGVFTAVLSAAAFNFFHLPPVGHFEIRNSSNWVALITFVVAADTHIPAAQTYFGTADLAAVAEYLKSQAAKTSTVSEPVAVPLDRLAAGTLYVNNCAQCHGPHGAGMPAATGGGPPLRGNPLVVAPDPTNVVRATVGGLPGHFGRVPMPSQLNGVTAAQLANIINYVRTSWGNNATPSVTPQMVFAMQAKTAPQ